MVVGMWACCFRLSLALPLAETNIGHVPIKTRTFPGLVGWECLVVTAQRER